MLLGSVSRLTRLFWLDSRKRGFGRQRPLIAQRCCAETYLDVIGLPPTPEEISSFLNNKSANAYQEAVDGLLARPQYGERWARHWLDLVRYAESNGYERDRTKPHAWRYRDYVIDAFNHDKPYDRFLTEQLAGDELSDSNAETQIAATFLRLGTWDDEPADPKVDRYDQLDDVLGGNSDGPHGPDAPLCPLPRSQVRAAYAERLLPPVGGLRTP